ncbi:hypothetical protein SPHINGO391_120027 [Sphingomonas aurantiaca]|uniref:Uncharacterized protein n=1 Tax=Sphingomonas aurantiaca TaxID=185949 RepID=A0A5E7XS88_9SPHN|nr:hypothetical protein SPHINGO391_120027 [Sphingomonas aurantiaca]
MRSRFQLEVALGRVGAEVVLQRAFDIDGVRVVPFDKVAVVAVHCPDEVGEPGPHGGRQAAAERGRFGGRLECEIDGVAIPRPALPYLHGLHGSNALAPVGDRLEVRFVGHVLQPLNHLLASLTMSYVRDSGPLQCPVWGPAFLVCIKGIKADPPPCSRNADLHMSKS